MIAGFLFFGAFTTFQKRKYEIIRADRIAPFINDLLDLGSNKYFDCLSAGCGIGCLLTYKMNFAIDDIGISQLDHINRINAIT